MLLITEATEGNGRRRVEVQGRLVGPWVGELRRVVTANRPGRPSAVVDLSSVSFADREGVRLLREFASLGILIRGVTPYIAELLAEEQGALP